MSKGISIKPDDPSLKARTQRCKESTRTHARTHARSHARTHALPLCVVSVHGFPSIPIPGILPPYILLLIRFGTSVSLGSYLIIPPLKPLKSDFSSLSSFPSESPFCSVIVLESHLYPSITAVIRFIHISHESGERLVLS